MTCAFFNYYCNINGAGHRKHPPLPRVRDKSKGGLVNYTDHVDVVIGVVYRSPVRVKSYGKGHQREKNMPIYAATVTIRRRDNTNVKVIENIVVKGGNYDDMKRNPENLKRALKYANMGKREDETRWVVIDIIIHKELGL